MSEYRGSSLQAVIESKSQCIERLSEKVMSSNNAEFALAFNKTWPESTPGPWQQTWNNWNQWVQHTPFPGK